MNEICNAKQTDVCVGTKGQCKKQKKKPTRALTLLLNFFTSLIVIGAVIFHVVSHVPLGLGSGILYIIALIGVFVSTAISNKQYRKTNGGEK